MDDGSYSQKQCQQTAATAAAAAAAAITFWMLQILHFFIRWSCKILDKKKKHQQRPPAATTTTKRCALVNLMQTGKMKYLVRWYNTKYCTHIYST